MRIAICDDEVYYREQFLGFVQKYALQNKSKEITVFTFTHAEELMEEVSKNGGFDIYLLDIMMPGMNGIELGKTLREKGYDEKIVYLTTSDEFAVASYKVEAADYILKPVGENEFISALDKVIKSISNRKDKSVIVKTKDGSIKISYDNIVYAELVKRNVVYHLGDSTKTESISVRTSFTDTVKELASDNRFIFAGKSMLLNMHHISGVRNETISFDNGEEITISRKLTREVHNTWLDFSISEVNGI